MTTTFTTAPGISRASLVRTTIALRAVITSSGTVNIGSVTSSVHSGGVNSGGVNSGGVNSGGVILSNTEMCSKRIFDFLINRNVLRRAAVLKEEKKAKHNRKIRSKTDCSRKLTDK